MRILRRFLLSQFIPVFFVSISLFVLILQVIELLSNLARYLSLQVSFFQILQVQLLYMPQAIAYSIPMSLLFAVAFTLGTLHSNNELIAAFAAGISIRQFTMPLIIFGLLSGFALFSFQELIVIDTTRAQKDLSNTLLQLTRSYSNFNVAVRSADGTVIYSAEYYDDTLQELSQIIIVERTIDGIFLRRIDAQRAKWNGEYWIFYDGKIYEKTQEDFRIVITTFRTLEEAHFSDEPRSFQSSTQDIEEMKLGFARNWIRRLRMTGQPYRSAQTSYYGRFAFVFTPFIVTLLSSAMAGRFKKNVMLMSLLLSLLVTIVYYVTNLLTGLMASEGILPPFAGAWTGAGIFILLGMIFMHHAKT